MKRLLFGFLFALLLPAVLTAQQKLKITFLIGDVDVFDESASAQGWTKAWYGLEVGENVRIRTGVNSRVELGNDRARFKISQRSVVKVSSLSSEADRSYTALQILTGKIWSSVNALGKTHKAEIFTPNAVVGVRGTEFVTGFESGDSSVMVFKGEVEFGPADRSSAPVVVPQYQMASMQGRTPPAAPEKIPFTAYQEWGMELPPVEPVKTPPAPAPAAPADPKKMSNAEILEMYQKKSAPPPTSEPVPQAETPPSAIEPAPSPEPVPQTEEPVQTEPAPSEPVQPKEPVKPTFAMNANIGPVSIDGVNWQQVILMPDFGMGPFGIGLYLPFYLDLAKPVFPNTSWQNYHDWDYHGWKDGFRDTLNKILYVRWGKKGDPLFVKIGSIDDITLGYGFVMNRFSNMLEFPLVRRLGLQFDVNTKWAGFETMTEDVFLFRIYGGRVYVNPLFFASAGPLKKMNAGYVHAVDDSPFGFPSNKTVIGVHGADLGTPLVETGVFKIDLFTAWATAYLAREGKPTLNHKGWGYTAGIRGSAAIVLFALEYRHLVNGFYPEYFDSTYMNERAVKAARMMPGFFSVFTPDVSVILGKLGIAFGQYGRFDIGYWAALNSKEDDNLLSAELVLAKGVIPKISGKARFEKTDIVSFPDLWYNFLDERTSIAVEGVLSVDSSVDLAFVLKRAYVRQADGSFAPLTTYSIETRFGFF
jgi:hypothetical protein